MIRYLIHIAMMFSEYEKIDFIAYNSDVDKLNSFIRISAFRIENNLLKIIFPTLVLISRLVPFRFAEEDTEEVTTQCSSVRRVNFRMNLVKTNFNFLICKKSETLSKT